VSSDQPEPELGQIAKPPKKVKLTGPADALAFVIATGGGAGMIPFAPGTFGSLVGLAVFYALFAQLRAMPHLLQSGLLAASVILSAAGIWAGARAERIFSRKDAGQIVIDEVAGQLISFSLVAPYLVAAASRPSLMMVIGFLLFRAFDIFKPYPIRRLEALGGGLGVMADDILAGIYAAILLSFVPLVAPQLLY